MARVLLTGARTAIALDLSRRFHDAGHTVVLADCFARHVAGHSRRVEKSVVTPSPRFERDAFAATIAETIERERITDLVPTGEESLWVATIQPQLPPRCRIHCDSAHKLDSLHDKRHFQRLAADVGPTLPTLDATDGPALTALRRDGPIVLKRRYSRFGQGVRRLEPGDLAPSDLSGWLAQRWVAGVEHCSFALARDGALVAHVAYEPRYRLPMGPSFYFRPLADTRAESWCRRFAHAHGLTGAFAIDFITDRHGTLWPLECNPRYTSGVHLFPKDADLIGAILGTGTSFPPPDRPAMWASAMLAFALPRARGWAELQQWFRDFSAANDVFWDPRDPSPAVHAFASRRELTTLQRRHGLTLSQATTWFTEWNEPPAS
jgi:hypothetical protein